MKEMKTQTRWNVVLRTGAIVAAAGIGFVAAQAQMFYSFSFSNEDGGTAGAVSGTISLPPGDGVHAATAVSVTFAPAMGYALPADFFSGSTLENSFTVSGGAIDLSNSHYFGLFNGFTALSLNSLTMDPRASFLDTLNAADFGASGVRDADSSTLAFGAVPEPHEYALFAGLGLLGLAAWRRRRA